MKQELMYKEQVAEFRIQDMLPIGLTFVVLGIGLAYGLDVMSDVRADFTAGTLEHNATTDAMTGVSKLTAKLPTIGLVVVASIVIGVLVRYLFANAR